MNYNKTRKGDTKDNTEMNCCVLQNRNKKKRITNF